MGRHDVPRIAIIDDAKEGEELVTLFSSNGLAEARVFHPREVSKETLRWADLALIDFQLDQWPEIGDGAAPIAQRPPDGLALAGILRRYAAKLQRDDPPTAMALWTGHVPDVAWPLPAETREHVLARMTNLEWVFPKGIPDAPPDTLGKQIASLASAVCCLPRGWPPDLLRRQLVGLLGLDASDPILDRKVEDVQECRPPVHELSTWSHGLAMLRWLLHRILPYPAFLWDMRYVAARLRTDVRSLREHVETESDLKQRLKAIEYGGCLAGFLGPRWWRSGVEMLVWEITGGRSGDADAVRDAVNTLAATALKPSAVDRPVVCVDENLRPSDDFSSFEEAVRVQPDDWPIFADRPWIPIEEVGQDPGLHALVVPEDREKLRYDVRSRSTGTSPGTLPRD